MVNAQRADTGLRLGVEDIVEADLSREHSDGVRPDGEGVEAGDLRLKTLAALLLKVLVGSNDGVDAVRLGRGERKTFECGEW